MPAHYQSLCVVMFMAVVVFAIVKPIFVDFMSEADYCRRRNLWLALTLTAFLAPSFWYYMPVASALLLLSRRREQNPAALYALLLLLLPPVDFLIPGFGAVNQLFPLGHIRLLCLILLLPAVKDVFLGEALKMSPLVRRCDVLLLGYLSLQIVLIMPYISLTGTMRAIFLVSLDTFLPYYIISRGCSTIAKIRELIACLVLALVVFIPMAVFEFGKAWLLYTSIGDRWGTPIPFSFIFRDDSLRAQLSMGHSIGLGYVMAVGLGGWFYMQSRIPSLLWSVGGVVGLGVGCIVALSRGPWLAAVAVILVYLGLGPNAGSRLLKGGVAIIIVAGCALASPLRDKFISYLPFVGSVEEGSVTYRQRLAEVSWRVIMENPLFGSPNFLGSMEEMRQGAGIIDLVNTYLTIALGSGLVGLGLFGCFFLGIALMIFKIVQQASRVDADYALLGSAILAALAGTFIVMGTNSFGHPLAPISWLIAGVGVSYGHVWNSTLASHQGERRSPPGLRTVSIKDKRKPLPLFPH